MQNIFDSGHDDAFATVAQHKTRSSSSSISWCDYTNANEERRAVCVANMMTMVEGTSIDLGDPIALDAAAAGATVTVSSAVDAAVTIGADGDLVVDVETVEERCERIHLFSARFVPECMPVLMFSVCAF